jgi:hypothetical protein
VRSRILGTPQNVSSTFGMGRDGGGELAMMCILNGFQLDIESLGVVEGRGDKNKKIR